MADVELRVTLVGDDPVQQEAFRNPQLSPTAPVMSSLPVSPASVQHTATTAAPTSPVQSQAVPTTVTPPPIEPPISHSASPNRSATGPQSPSSQPQSESGKDGKLIDTIEQLIDAINELTSSRQFTAPTNSSTRSRQRAPSEGNWMERLVARFEQRIDDLGLKNTGVGDAASSMAQSMAGFGTRVSKFAGNFFGTATEATAARGATTAASAAASESAAAGAGAAVAGTEAAAGTTAAAGASGALAGAAAPIAAVALAAGAAALSLKAFIESVNKVAGQLADVSPQIAAGESQHDAKMELAKLDRAKRIGSDVANLNAATHRISESMYEVQTKIYELLLKASPILETGIDGINLLIQGAAVDLAVIQKMMAKLTFWDNTDDIQAQKNLTHAMKGLADAWTAFTDGYNANGTYIDPRLAELLQMDGNAGVPKRGAANAGRGGNRVGNMP